MLKGVNVEIEISRRHFLKVTAFLAAGGLQACATLANQSKIANRPILLPGNNGDGNSKLLIFNPDTLKLKHVDIPLLFPHSCARNPINENKVTVMEQGGNYLCAVDIIKGELERVVENSRTNPFYGHGVFSPNGEILYTSEFFLDDKYRGLISIREARSLKKIGEFDSHGIGPHDFKADSRFENFIIANQGVPASKASDILDSSITFVNIKTRQLVAKYPLTEPLELASHLFRLNDSNFLVASRKPTHIPLEIQKKLNTLATDKSKRQEYLTLKSKYDIFYQSPLYLANIKNGLTLLEAGVNKKNQIGGLSFAVDNKRNRIALTYPYSGKILFWNVEDYSYQGQISLPESRPTGIKYFKNGELILVTFQKGGAKVFRADNYKEDNSIPLPYLPTVIHIT